jgi:hypothetical protein
MKQESNLHHKEDALFYQQANDSSERQHQERHEKIAQLALRLRRMKRRLLLEVAEEQSLSQQDLDQAESTLISLPCSFSAIEE